MENRTAAAPISEAPVEVGSGTHEKTEMVNIDSIDERVDTYAGKYGKPYSAKYFDIKDYAEYSKQPKLDIDSILPRIKEIDEYVMGIINEKGLQPTTKSFDFLMDEILEQIGKLPTEEGKYKLDRIHTYVNKFKEYESARKSLEELKNKLYGPKTDTSIRTGKQKLR